jgi:hypothetical protein
MKPPWKIIHDLGYSIFSWDDDLRKPQWLMKPPSECSWR